MSAEAANYLGLGIYSVPEAARLAGLTPQTLRNWINGYESGKGSSRHKVGPVISRQLPILDDQVAIGFLNLVELRVIAALLKEHFSLQAIRVTHSHARDLLKAEYPFAMKRFKTGLSGIFTRIDESLIDVRKKQYALEIIEPLLADLDFEADLARRWWPIKPDLTVVIDPSRRFGQPIIADTSMPTRLLYDSYKTEEDIDTVAEWFGVSPKTVRSAIAFETKYAA